MAGLPATNGSRALADFVPARSAACVDRLVDAGAVDRRQDEQPRVLLPRRHRERAVRRDAQPAGPGRAPAGGSSGGAAASVAAGMVPLAVGTDGGGSIRIPSAFCGVYGLKPTFGLVPKMPGFRGWPTLSVTGPIAASVRDLALALSVMAGPSARRLAVRCPTVGTPDYLAAVAAPSWGGLRVAVSADLGFGALDADVRAAFQAAVDAAVAAGVQVVDVPHARADRPGAAVGRRSPCRRGAASEGRLVEQRARSGRRRRGSDRARRRRRPGARLPGRAGSACGLRRRVVGGVRRRSTSCSPPPCR